MRRGAREDVGVGELRKGPQRKCREESEKVRLRLGPLKRLLGKVAKNKGHYALQHDRKVMVGRPACLLVYLFGAGGWDREERGRESVRDAPQGRIQIVREIE